MQASLQQGASAPSQAYGYKVGDLVFYTGQSQTFADGDKVAHGQQGNVLGVMFASVPTHLRVRFSGNKGYVGLRFNEVRRLRAASAATPSVCPHTLTLCRTSSAQISRIPPPPLHGGYKVGEKLFYTWPSRTFEHNGTTYKLVQGQQGEVMGPGTGQHEPKGTGLAMLFPGNKGCVDCVLAKVSLPPRRLRCRPLPAPHRATPAHIPSGRPQRPPPQACRRERSRSQAVAQRPRRPGQWPWPCCGGGAGSR